MFISFLSSFVRLFSFFFTNYRIFYQSFFFFSYILENFILVIRFHFYALELISVNERVFDLLLVMNSSIFFMLRCLLDIVVRDFLVNQNLFRFSVTYVLLSVKYNFNCYVTVLLKEFNVLPSVINLYANANWSEREVWDMFGVFFINHGDLRRLLTDYNFYYFPLRNDFPLTGFFELYYSEIKQQIVLMPVSLSQEYRFFSLNSAWVL